jgi:hypothetical protein
MSTMAKAPAKVTAVTSEQVEKALDWLLHHLGWREPEEVMNMPLEWS